jgi:hypothetical protein
MKIAMKCNQEQWDSIKDKLTNYHLITNFDKANYLINCHKDSTITNLDYGCASAWADEFNETWNEQIFLEACGIETKKIFKAGELQFMAGDKWYNTVGEYRLKPNNTAEIEALEKQKLEIDKQINKLR